MQFEQLLWIYREHLGLHGSLTGFARDSGPAGGTEPVRLHEVDGVRKPIVFRRTAAEAWASCSSSTTSGCGATIASLSRPTPRWKRVGK
jgi:hypothetical protein